MREAERPISGDPWGRSFWDALEEARQDHLDHPPTQSLGPWYDDHDEWLALAACLDEEEEPQDGEDEE